MRIAHIYRNGIMAGELREEDRNHYVFKYDEHYYNDTSKPAISLTLPKATAEYHADYLFPFFFNMLPEGANKQVACRQLHIDPDDYFGLLLATAQYDTIGAVTVKKITS